MPTASSAAPRIILSSFKAVDGCGRTRSYETTICKYCEKVFQCRKGPSQCCSASCAMYIRSPEVSARMKAKNPTRLKHVREGNSRRLKGKPFIGIQGGNGKVAPMEQRLWDAIPELRNNFSIATMKSRTSGFPTCYKVDLAAPAVKLAIEVDGGSHNSPSRRVQDRKKEKLLSGLGWQVLRFKNADVETRLPWVEAEVRMSIALRSVAPIASSLTGS